MPLRTVTGYRIILINQGRYAIQISNTQYTTHNKGVIRNAIRNCAIRNGITGQMHNTIIAQGGGANAAEYTKYTCIQLNASIVPNV